MFELVLTRNWCKPTHTIGRLYLPNGELLCNTLEDPDRGLDHSGDCECTEMKVKGCTCIPYGTYELIFCYSPKFSPRYNMWMPTLLNVPHFSGILIHPGNTVDDTSGCILPGENKQVGKVLNSTYWFTRITSIIRPLFDQGEKLVITIKKP